MSTILLNKEVLDKIFVFLEQLVLDDHKEVKNNWEKDFDIYVTPLVEENQPCYILYR